MANWSRFVRPGAVRVSASGGPSGARVSAFKNQDGTVSVQVIQGGTSSGSVSVRVGGMQVKDGDAKAWITDNSHDVDALAVTVETDGSVSATVPGRSMVTFVLNGAN